MANIKINNAIYNAVPHVTAPKADGSGNAVFYDTSDANGTAGQIPTGVTVYNANGKVNGSATFPTVSQDSATKVVHIS